MATDAQLSLVRKFAPEFQDVSNDDIYAEIDLYSDMLSESYYGPFYDRALAYFVAHQMTLEGVAKEDGVDDSYLTAGAVLQERLGNSSRQYESSGTSYSDALYGKTYYGRMFLQIRNMRRIPGMTRM